MKGLIRSLDVRNGAHLESGGTLVGACTRLGRVSGVFAVVAALLIAVSATAYAIPGVKTGLRWRSSCSVAAPQPWVNGRTQGTTYIKGPGRTDTVMYFNSSMQNRQVIDAYNGGDYRVEGLTHIDITQTYGYCSD